MTLFVIAVYLGVVLFVGLASHRLFRGTKEDFFVATRTISPLVLLLTLFGTNMTAFALLGASAESYRVGIGVFGLMASSTAIVAPLVFLFVGTRVWTIGKRFGFVTQLQFLRARYGSEPLAILVFVVLVLLLVPYLLIGVLGGGLTLADITGGAVPQWLGSLVICLVVLAYVIFGGMRGTAWVNSFQTVVFMSLGALTAILIVRELGGLPSAFERLAVSRPDLLVRGESIRPVQLSSYLLIPLSVGAFPHIFSHWLSARSATAFKVPILFYPLCVAAVWIPSVVLGTLGHLSFPDLAGPATNGILVQLIALHAPEILAGLLGAGVFAAIMSSLDSQSLALGSMFTNDIVAHYGLLGRHASEERVVWTGRLFVAAVIGASFVLSLVSTPRIFGLSIWSFSGFASLVPVIVAALYWRRSTAFGALASVATTIVLWIVLFLQSRAGAPPTFGPGFMPVVLIFTGSCVALVVGSLLSKPPPDEVVDRFVPRRAR